MITLQTPEKQERQVTPKKTPEKRNEDDEYAGSTDMDEPGLHQTQFNRKCHCGKQLTEGYVKFGLRFNNNIQSALPPH